METDLRLTFHVVVVLHRSSENHHLYACAVVGKLKQMATLTRIVRVDEEGSCQTQQPKRGTSEALLVSCDGGRMRGS